MSTLVCRLFVALTTPLALLLGADTASAADLAPGDMAPAFELAGSDGNTYTLSQFVGKQGVVLAWFPRAFTPG
jgi:peroxiredoxin Q/BCP